MVKRTSPQSLISPLVLRYLDRVQQQPDKESPLINVAPAPQFSSHSLAMPGDTQEIILKQLCALVKVPFAETESHDTHSLVDFATLLARGSEDPCPPWSLLLYNHNRKHNLATLTALSDALRAQQLPIELRHLVEDAQRQLPTFDVSHALDTVSVPLPSKGCCFPMRRKMLVSEPERAAMHALNEAVMASLLARILRELRKEYPLYAHHDALYAVCITAVMLVCYEALRLAAAAHTSAKKEHATLLKQTHAVLMNRPESSLQSATSKGSSQETLVPVVVDDHASLPFFAASTQNVEQDAVEDEEKTRDMDSVTGQDMDETVTLTEALRDIPQETEDTVRQNEDPDMDVATPCSPKKQAASGLQYSPAPVPLASTLSVTPSLVNMQAFLSSAAQTHSSTFESPFGCDQSVSAMAALRQARTMIEPGIVLPGHLFDHSSDASEPLAK